MRPCRGLVRGRKERRKGESEKEGEKRERGMEEGKIEREEKSRGGRVRR